MKVIKGEKYLCSNGPKKGQLFRVLAFLPLHIACENLTDPIMGVEHIVKFYFLNSFKEYQHREKIKLDSIDIQQIVSSINVKLRSYVDSGVISEAVFFLIAGDVGKVMMSEFLKED